MGRMVRELTAKVSITLQIDGRDVVDEVLAGLLLCIKRYGSILSASKSLGIPYSKAWEALSKAERALGVKLVRSRRGGGAGGGTQLTQEGERILEEYADAFRRFTGREFTPERIASFTVPELVYMGSHDPGVELLAGLLKEKGINDVELSWVGSAGGVAAVMLGETDVAGIHLFDPESGMYNVPYLKKYWLEGKAVIVRGYEREIGWVSRQELRPDEVLGRLLNSGLKLINRQAGSGSRVILEHILREEAKRKFRQEIRLENVIKGFDKEVATHVEVAKAVASGEADVGLCIKWAAVQYGLNFIPIKWERFDFLVPRGKLGKRSVKAFIDTLRSRDFRDALSRLPGFRVSADVGSSISY
ncbi:MAG: LysR family transcriptional regulator [Desulfurococcales archaeon]|nr:LysR family transcriptional regulator [Desulfurococcales archaeon]